MMTLEIWCQASTRKRDKEGAQLRLSLICGKLTRRKKKEKKCKAKEIKVEGREGKAAGKEEDKAATRGGKEV